MGLFVAFEREGGGGGGGEEWKGPSGSYLAQGRAVVGGMGPRLHWHTREVDKEVEGGSKGPSTRAWMRGGGQGGGGGGGEGPGDPPARVWSEGGSWWAGVDVVEVV